MKLNDLKPKKGATKRRKRVGRGRSSGHGKTSGRGEKGAKSRSGYSRKPGFEGGQLPLIRRLPKRGFNNPFKTDWAEVNVDALVRFEADSVVDPEALESAGLVKGRYDKIVILGRGEVDRSLTVRAHRFSKSAADKIAAAGGSAEVIE